MQVIIELRDKREKAMNIVKFMGGLPASDSSSFTFDKTDTVKTLRLAVVAAAGVFAVYTGKPHLLHFTTWADVVASVQQKDYIPALYVVFAEAVRRYVLNQGPAETPVEPVPVALPLVPVKAGV